MRTRLVVNADDLGLDPDLDAGILAAQRSGIVTSTTVLVTGPTAAPAVRAASRQGLAMGVHLALVGGLPPASAPEQVPSLAPGGRLRSTWWEFCRDAALGRIRWAEVDRELDAQWSRAQELGARPDHLDSHQHLHLLPGVQQRVERLARSARVPLRWSTTLPRLAVAVRHPGGALKAAALAALGRLRAARGITRVRTLGSELAGTLTESDLLNILDALPPGDSELGCHPGFRPASHASVGFSYGWDVEQRALCSPAVQQRIRDRGIDLVTYRDLTARRG